jgi:glycosyltransferase 2 family protein
MKKYAEYIWPLIGLAAVVGSFYLLYHEFEGEKSIGADVWAALTAISLHNYLLAGASTLLAYAALAWYDRIALLHLGVTHISWAFISLCSFSTYALSHNIGASVFSGAMVRYRAYSSKGLTAAQVAVLVVLCSFTFGFGNVVLGGALLTYDPGLFGRLSGLLPDFMTNTKAGLTAGLGCLALVAIYVIGSLMHFRPVRLFGMQIVYPRPEVMTRQLFAAPLELIGSAGIIYFALPESANVDYYVILGAFLFSFVVALLSHAPGGLGVFELIFVRIMPDVPRVKILAALLVWRLFYLIIPLLFSLVVVALFERKQLAEKLRARKAASAEQPGSH